MRQLTVLALSIAMLLTALQACAMSVSEYKSRTIQQRAEYVAGAIDKIVADVNKANPELAHAIHDYFYVKPAGRSAAPGVTAFEGDLAAIEDAAAQGKLDRDKVQIEGILLGIIKRDIVLKQKVKG